MLEFLKTYWKVIALGVLFCLDVLLVILNRRKPNKVYDSVHQTILSVLPDLIKSAEASFISGQGQQKLQMVIELVDQLLISVYGLSGEEVKKYDSFIKASTESILSTPQKKEEK